MFSSDAYCYYTKKLSLQHAGEAQHSFVTELIETEERHGLSKKQAAWLAAIMVYVNLRCLLLHNINIYAILCSFQFCWR